MTATNVVDVFLQDMLIDYFISNIVNINIATCVNLFECKIKLKTIIDI